MATTELSPAAKHRRSLFGFEPTYEKRWNSAAQLHVLQQKTPHRYQQSPVFTRKLAQSDDSYSKHHHHHRHHKHSPRRHRKRGVSEGDKSSVPSDENVHLLSSLPWRKSDSSSSDSLSEEPVVDNTKNRQMLFNFSPSLPQRLDSRLQLEREARERSHHVSPLFQRRMNMRSRSEGSSPVHATEPTPQTDNNNNEFVAVSNPNYLSVEQPIITGQLVIDVQAAVIPLPPSHVLSPESDPETPLAGSEDYFHASTLDVVEEEFPPPPSPHTLRRFLGLETEPHPTQGLTEEEILKARLFARRFSASSESSTSTLT